MGDGPCPSTWEIAAIAGGGEVDDAARTHAERCPQCRERLELAREETRFLARMKELVSSDLGAPGAPFLPGYRAVEVLSSGSQGVVYRGVQESTSRPVAIKTLLAGHAITARQRARAEREAEVAARLRHPNIVTVYESRTLRDGRIAVVMEFVDGVPIDEWRPPGATREERQRGMLRVFIAVCGAIHHAHLNGVIHRDVKPDNILVTPEGRPVVLDFGIAKAGGLHTTVTGEFAGTPAYASPEQVALKPDDVDALTDVYSLGVILYQLLTGTLPYEVGETLFEVARTIGETPPVPPRRKDPTLHPDLEAVVLKALRKEKAHRYHSAASLAADLERYLAGEPVEARSGSGWYLLRKAVAVNRRRLVAAGVVVAALAGAGAAVLVSAERTRASAKQVEQSRAEARTEGVRARAVAELLGEALPNVDPARPEIATVIGSGLSRLHFRLETGAFADDPEVDQAIRRMWAGVYTEFGEGKAAGLVEFAEVSLRNGLVRLRQEPKATPLAVAGALHDLAGIVFVRRRPEEAQRLAEEALRMREAAAGSASVSAAESRMLLSRILLARERLDEADREADAALVVFRRLPDQESDRAIARLLGVKSRVAMARGDAAAAEPWVREALKRQLRREGSQDPELLGSLTLAAEVIERRPDSNLARDAHLAFGGDRADLPARVRADTKTLAMFDRLDVDRVRETGQTAALDRLIALAEVLLGRDDPSLVRLLYAKSRSATVEGNLGARADASERAAALLSARFSRDDPAVLVCVEDAASARAYEGRVAEAADLAGWACSIYERVPVEARDRLTIGNAHRVHGWYLAMAGRFAEAIPRLREALGEIEEGVGAHHHVHALASAMLAYGLARGGTASDLPEADTLSRHAIDLLSLPAVAGDQRLHIRFARGVVLRELARADEARGDHAASLARLAEARATLEGVWDDGYSRWWRNFPWRRENVDSMIELCRTIGDAAGEAEWRSRLTAPGYETAPPYQPPPAGRGS